MQNQKGGIMPDIKFGTKTFTDVENINLPLADGTGQASFGTGSLPEHIEWHQCPEAVRNYLDNVTYDPDDYSVSQIADYAPASPVVSNYKPIGKAVGDKSFYNEIPNVETLFQSDDIYGTVKPLDHVRYINTPVAPNVRDIGGWACDGGTVRYGLLYRGGYLSLADRDVLVDELGIRHDLDLRGATEKYITSSPLGDDVHFTRPLAYNWYSLTNKEIWKQNLRCVFDAVTYNEPLYFHCAAGADRTGTLACVLEGLLGMSQSDIDKDYELTCFYFGTNTDEQARRRNESEWQGLINSICAYTGDSFRDKCVSFVATLGFTADEINAYRNAMIDGEPEDIILNTKEYVVTLNASNKITVDNEHTMIQQYQAYNTDINALHGYAIKDIQILMGGKDVTRRYFKGNKTAVRHAVMVTASNCIVNCKASVIDKQDFVATINSNVGYDINSVTITMGGVDMSTYYSDGTIAIPNVTGNIEITVTAIENTPDYTNLADPNSDEWLDDYRINSSAGTTECEGIVISNKIYCNKGDTIRIYGIDITSEHGLIGLYNADYWSLFYTSLPASHADSAYCVKDDVINNNGVYEWIVGQKNDGTYTSTVVEYILISGELAVDKKSEVIITINEEIN